MISLAKDCLLCELTTGETIPLSSEMISVELIQDAPGKFEPEILRHAAAAVFHYFRNDLGRDTITAAEFAEALEKALQGFGMTVSATDEWPVAPERVEGDLRILATESGHGCELVFFPRLRNALREQLRRSPQLVRFHSLRSCVKQLVGAQRWSPRCENLHDNIVEYLRSCLGVERHEESCSLLVE